jgi:hypothetical protein
MDSFEEAIDTNKPRKAWRPERHGIESCVPDIMFNLKSFSPDDQVQLQAVLAHLEFVEASDRREQIAAACKILRAPDRRRRFTLEDGGKFLRGISGAVIDQQLRKAHEIRQVPGRPYLFTAEIERWIETVVKERYEARAAISYSELLDLLQYRHATVVSSDTLRHRIRSMPSVRSVPGIPTEAGRVVVGSEIIMERYRALATKIEGVPRAFIDSVDETG